jgi:hypothetical protein
VLQLFAILALLLLLAIGVTVALYEFLGWKGLALAFVLNLAAIWFGIILVGKAIGTLIAGPFKAKGRVLENASIETNSIVAAAVPDYPRDSSGYDDEDDEDMAGYCRIDQADFENRRWYTLDVTVRPAASGGGECTPFQHWQPTGLELVHIDKLPMSLDDDDDDGGDEYGACRIHHTAVWANGAFRPADDLGSARDGDAEDEDDEFDDGELFGKVTGEQRLRLLIGVLPNADTLKFAYYFEQFGRVDVPR